MSKILKVIGVVTMGLGFILSLATGCAVSAPSIDLEE